MVDFKKKLEEASKKIAKNAIKTIPGIAAAERAINITKGSKKEIERRQEVNKKEIAKTQQKAPAKVTTNQAVSKPGPIQAKAQQRGQQKQSQPTRPSMSRQDVQSMIVNIAQQEGVDPSLALAVAQQESGFNPNAVGDGGKSFGLFQIHQPSHPDYQGGTNPEANARYGIRYLKGLLDANNGNVHDALWAYNAGSGNKAKGILPASTKQYISNITSLAGQFDKQGFSNVQQAPTDNRPAVRGMAPANNITSAQQGIPQQPAQQLTPPTKPDVVTSSPQLDTLKLQLQEGINDPRNAQLSIPTMYNRLADKYAELQNTIQTQDPRYQGELVQGPKYQVDPGILQARATYDRMAGGPGGQGVVSPNQGSAQAYLDQQRMMYEQAMANQAGVPYDDYKAAMMDRQKQMISAQAAQIDSELKMALANEENVFRKQQLMGQIEQNAVSAQNAMNQLDYQLKYGTYSDIVSAQNNQYLQALKNIAAQEAADKQFNRDLMKLDYQNKLGIYRDSLKPQSQSSQWSALNAINAMAGYDPQKAGKLMQASGLGPQLFPQMTPEMAQELFGGPQQTKQQGFWQTLRNKVGLQANEQ